MKWYFSFPLLNSFNKTKAAFSLLLNIVKLGSCFYYIKLYHNHRQTVLLQTTLSNHKCWIFVYFLTSFCDVKIDHNDNINGGDVQRKIVVNNVDKSSLWAPWQNGSQWSQWSLPRHNDPYHDKVVLVNSIELHVMYYLIKSYLHFSRVI